MRKKGDVWISAVLYIALGIIILTLILAAGLPLINKVKDKNTFMQTKNILFNVDGNIREVISEGSSSQRYISPFTIKEGEISFFDNTEKIIWTMKTKARLMEPNVDFTEGFLNIKLLETNVEDQYELQLSLDYEDLCDLLLESTYSNPFSGDYNLLVQNTGTANSEEKPIIKLIIS